MKTSGFFPYCSLLILVITLTLRVDSFSQPPICGCSDIQDTYPNDPGIIFGSHAYNVSQVVICNRRQAGCTRSFVYQTMLGDASLAAPDAAHVPVQDCHDYYVRFFGNLGSGTITVKLNESAYQLTNYTRKDHDLHPGKVVRQVLESPNGDITVRSIGTGSGFLPKINQLNAPSLWAGVEELLRNEVQRKLPAPETIPFSATTVATQPSGKRAEAGDLVIVEVMNTANLGLFTTDVPASGYPSGRQHYNKPAYANLPHGVVLALQGGHYYPCVKNPFTQGLSAANRLLSSNAPQVDGTIFLASQQGDIRFELNDQSPENNWGDYEVVITLVPFSQHRGRDAQTALVNYLAMLRR